MRDDERRADLTPRPGRGRDAARLGRLFLLSTALTVVVVALPARSQTMKGYAEIQYQSQDLRMKPGEDIERWIDIVHLDYGRRFGNAYDLTLQGEWNEIFYVDLPTRQVNPRGTLRLAHRYFGTYASYRTLRSTGLDGNTSRQHETTLNAYLREPGIPQVQGTYVRRYTLPYGLTPGATGATTTLNARHDMGPVGLRAAWTNQQRFTDLDKEKSMITQNSYSGGGDWRYARSRTSANASVDFQDTRLTSYKGPTSSTGTASLSLNGTHRLARIVDAGLTYGYQHTTTRATTERNLNNHDGSLLFTARPKRSLTFSTGGGVRTTTQAEAQSIERYLVIQAGVLGPIRRGWTGNAGLSRSYNWFPNGNSRPVNSGLVNTDMRLARGLDVHAQLTVTKAGVSEVIADTSGAQTTLTSQAVYGFTATPLQPISFGFTRSEYRTGEKLLDPDGHSRSDTFNARWNPVPSFRFSGTLGRSRGLKESDPTLSTSSATLDWAQTPTVQWTGSYAKSEQAQYNALTRNVLGNEVWGLRLVASILQVWRVQASVNDVDPGRPTNVRQWDAILTRILGR